MTTEAKRKLTSSLEDYLEAVLYLVREGRVARVRDIAARLGVGMSAVTAAMKTLSKRGLVNYDPYQVITLTDRGRLAAQRVTDRHRFLRAFQMGILGLDEESAEANACRLEHAVDEALLDRLHRFSEFLQDLQRSGQDIVNDFATYCRQSETANDD